VLINIHELSKKRKQPNKNTMRSVARRSWWPFGEVMGAPHSSTSPSTTGKPGMMPKGVTTV
jgi:hypothetical protein